MGGKGLWGGAGEKSFHSQIAVRLRGEVRKMEHSIHSLKGSCVFCKTKKMQDREWAPKKSRVGKHSWGPVPNKGKECEETGSGTNK